MTPVQVELLDDLPDAAIEAVVAAAATGTTVEVRQWVGAIAAAQPSSGPVGARGAALTVIGDAPVPGLAEHATGGAYLKFLTDTTRTTDAFTPATTSPARRALSSPVRTCAGSGQSSAPTIRRACSARSTPSVRPRWSRRGCPAGAAPRRIACRGRRCRRRSSGRCRRRPRGRSR